MKVITVLNKTLKQLGKMTPWLVMLTVVMSSCVYSLFPIYTEETTIFDPILLGTWEDKDGYTLRFEHISDSNTGEKAENDKKLNYTDSLIGEGWAIRSEEPISIEIGGKLVYDKALITAHMDSLMQGLVDLGEEKEDEVEDSDDKVSSASWLLNQSSIEGSISANGEKTYRMIVQQNEEDESVYKVHLVKIGENYFIDLFPLVDTKRGAFTENLFPVHTFMKVDFDENTLNLISFDLEKLNEMFVKNLVRLRHENVNGTVLITAQPGEIQKFLNVYGDVEEVYEQAIIYQKVAG